jgi:hypothetical protein
LSLLAEKVIAPAEKLVKSGRNHRRCFWKRIAKVNALAYFLGDILGSTA